MIIFKKVGLGEGAKLPAPVSSLSPSAGYVAFPLSTTTSFFIQWFSVYKTNDGTTTKAFTFPVAFPNACSSIVAADSGGAAFSYGFDSLTKNGGSMRVSVANASANANARVIAVGF